MKRVTIFLAAAMLLGLPSRGRAAPTCAGVAKAEVSGMCKMNGNTIFTVIVDNPTDGFDVACNTGASEHRTIVFSHAAGQLKAPPAARGDLPRSSTTPTWASIIDASKKGCPDLRYVVYETTAPQAPTPTPAPVSGFEADLHAALREPAKSADYAPLASLKQYRGAVANRSGVVKIASGVSTGAFDSVAQEAVQILGQIVVDRASAQAYQLIKSRLLTLLGCGDDGKSSKQFDATCRLLVPLRIEDIASSREALLRALVADIVQFIETETGGKKSWDDALGPTFSSLLATGVIPLIARPKAVLDDSIARTILDSLLTYATAEIKAPNNPDPAEKALVVGLTAYLQCLHPGTDQPGDLGDPGKVLAACDVGANVDNLTSDPKIRPAAHAVAQALVVVGTPTSSGGDPRGRVVHAIDLVFASTCMLLRDKDAAAIPRFVCDDPASLSTVTDGVALLQPIADDAVLGETNALVAAAVHALQLTDALLKDKTKGKEINRAFVLVGGLLDYTGTYTNTSGASTDDLHDQRTKILESLTTSMTDRTARAGDTIISVGGALRLVAGRTWSVDSSSVHAFYGPLSLPLGFALTHLPSGDCPIGFHMQLDAVDLGQYLSYDKEANVRKPDLEDALAPSVTIGFAAGTSVPFVAGITGAYEPHFAVDPNAPTTKGAFSLGVTAGFAVPLLDIN